MPEANKSIPSLLQDEIITGLMLGDGYITCDVKGNQRLMLGQSTKNNDLIENVCKHFNSLGLKSSTRNQKKYDQIQDKTYHSKLLTTSRNPSFNNLRNVWYNERTRIVPNKIVLTDKVMAYWFMCDGSSEYRNNRLSVGVILHTNNFTEYEIISLQKQIKEKFNITFRISNQGKWKLMKISKNYDSKKFMDLVKPFIVPCFMYKLKYL